MAFRYKLCKTSMQKTVKVLLNNIFLKKDLNKCNELPWSLIRVLNNRKNQLSLYSSIDLLKFSFKKFPVYVYVCACVYLYVILIG